MQRAQGSGSLARPSLGLRRWEAKESLYRASLPPPALELSLFGVEPIIPTSASSEVLTPCHDHGPRVPLLMEGDPEPPKLQREFWVPLAVPWWEGHPGAWGLHPASSLFLPSNPSPRLLRPRLGTLEARLLPYDHRPGWAPTAFPQPMQGPLAGLQPPPPPCPLSLQTKQSSGNTPGNTTAVHRHVQGLHACRTSVHL